MNPEAIAYWSSAPAEVLRWLRTPGRGLKDAEARVRLGQFGANVLRPRRRTGTAALLLSQFKSPIVLILLFAASLAFFLGQHTDASIILVIVVGSGLLGFWQERGAAAHRGAARPGVDRGNGGYGREVDIPVEEVVPGDLVVLKAGDIVPAIV